MHGPDVMNVHERAVERTLAVHRVELAGLRLRAGACTRAARTLKPCSSSCAMIFPALPAPKASGLMIVSV